MVSGTAFSTSFLISSSGNWRKTLNFEVFRRTRLLAVREHYRLITSAHERTLLGHVPRFHQSRARRNIWWIINKLLWARKYARIVVRGYYLFREANSCPRAKLEGNCELRGTDNVQIQLFVHISEVKSSLLSLLSFKYFLLQRKQRREPKLQNKTSADNVRSLSVIFDGL